MIRFSSFLLVPFFAICSLPAFAQKPQTPVSHESLVATDARVAFLVDEMTTTPERQQKALDQIVLIGDAVLPVLFAHLGDERPLATRDVRFLNTFPDAFEKYSLTEATRIDEVIIKLICPRVASCDQQFNVYDPTSVRAQREKLIAWCKFKYRAEKLNCSGRQKSNSAAISKRMN